MANMPQRRQVPTIFRPLHFLPDTDPHTFPESALLILQAFVRLTKTITVNQDEPGSPWTTTPLASAKNFHFYHSTPNTLEDMFQLILALSRNPKFALVSGKPTELVLKQQVPSPIPIKFQRRSRQTDDTEPTIEMAPTKWWIADVENLIIPNLSHTPEGVAHIRDMLVEQGLRTLKDVSLVYQWTASAGKNPNEARIRLIAHLTEPTHLADLAAWSSQAPSLDQTIYRPAQLIYTALPEFTPASADPIPRADRIGILESSQLTLTLPEVMRETSSTGSLTPSNPLTTLEEDLRADPILRALQDQDLLKSRKAPGVWDITCPWLDEHTGQADDGAAYFQPYYAGRAYPGFKCHHAHCEHRNIRDLKQHLDPDLANHRVSSARSTGALSYALTHPETRSHTPPDVQPDPLAAPPPLPGTDDILNLSDIELSSTVMSDLQRRYIYVVEQDVFYDLILHKMHKPETLGRAYQYAFSNPTLARAMLNSHATIRATSIIYLPGQPPLVDWGRPQSVHVNAWQALSRPPAIPGSIKPWMNHVEWLIPVRKHRNHILDWMAYVLQHQDTKVNHALLLAGTPGNGKDTIFEPLKEALGRNNVSEPNAEELTEKFTNFLWRKKLVVFQESKNFDRVNVENKLKPMLATPPETLRVRAFGEGFLDTPNLVQPIFFSNHRDSVQISKDDRRYFCLWLPQKPNSPEYYTELYNWYHGEGYAHVHHWLLNRDISQFTPKATPPDTPYKKAIQDLSLTSLEMMIKDDIDARTAPMEGDIVGLRMLLNHPTAYPRANLKSLSRALHSLGCLHRAIRFTTPDGTRRKRNLWCVRDKQLWNARPDEMWVKEFMRT